ncbi:MAG: metal ABC transporter ATP-binding protein [Chlamydia suis]|uniref:metal ABC transporter ATP-binding protein n=1 Tax=Chlamydia suis TaxID=83559 RepID=UPI0009AFE3B3|nr:metal ABC transporter ATP-binding protein [Chlamydia suis]MDD6309768.1 metal ABC transporter ATP-binding protein [Chlamydia suis]
MTKQVLLENVSFRYGKTGPLIVDHVSCEICSGDFIGIIGPNGGGKTTLTQIMLGLLQPTCGRISTYSTRENSPLSIGWVPQHFAYDAAFPITVKETVLSGRLATLPWYGRYTKQDHEAAEEALHTVDLLPYRDSCFSHLSGGQIQRVLLARALAARPEFLLLDEPTANIDPANQQKILQILSALNQHCTILMITHDLHHTAGCFNKVFFMNKKLTALADTKTISERFCCNTFGKNS